MPTTNESPDQRLKGRYPISLAVQYKLIDGRRTGQFGVGKTLNISSGGVLFEPDRPLPANAEIEVAIMWPFLLDGVCRLKLVMRGHIVRHDPTGIATAVRAEYRELRTASMRSLTAP